MFKVFLSLHLLVFVVTNNEDINDFIYTSSDFIFDTPDVIKEYFREDGTKVTLEAYRTKNNEKHLANNQHSSLRWFSLGQPEITDFSKNSRFGFRKLSFWVLFEMLTSLDKKELAEEVRRDKNIVVNPSQFSDLDANTIECFIELYDVEELKTVTLKGKVFNFKKSPYEIDFKYPVGTKERNLFEQEIKTEPNLKFICNVTAGAQVQKSNTFTLTLQESNNLRLSDKLFGPANEVYVTRDQLTELSNEVNSYFNVIEDYQISQEQFSSAFVDNLISLSGQTTFKSVSLDDALKSLSKYTMEFRNDLDPDQIKKDLSEVFKIEKLGNKSRIVFDEKYYKELEKQSSESGAASASVKVFGMGKGSASASYAKSQANHWLEKGSSLDDQLRDLNTYSENKMKYEFEGNKIVPKTLQVSKLQASAFKRTLSFSRIKNYYYEADYNRVFTLNTQNSKELINQFQLQSKIEFEMIKKEILKDKINQIRMISSEKMLQLFGSDGKGTGEMSGWYLCDGQNGTPDLRGRFLVGKGGDGFEQVGKTGGAAKVKLTSAQIPSHSHPHFHQVNLNTNAAGSHNHAYLDIYFSEFHTASSNWVSVPGGVGSARSDNDNHGHQMWRATEFGGPHSHRVDGVTGNSDVAAGGDQEHENRPPFYVVQYIIFLGQ
ncbi:uncharacterized protein LOC136086703 [Hydra vulgaris]|uniref:Uncharacterized protein LOC136086703 n=1 Tax=Hydra vulgaris TaxID=6087 RepID=A0ABM4CT27_HYDVU